MKQARYEFLKNRPSPHKVSYYDSDGKRRAKCFTLQSDAFAFIAKCNESVILPDELQFSVDERMSFAAIKKFCVANDILISEVPTLLSNGNAINTDAGYLFDDAFKAYLAHLTTRRVRQDTYVWYERIIKRFIAQESPKNVKDITQARAKSYLASILSPIHKQRVLRAFYSFCKERGWVSVNPFEGALVSKRLKERELPSVMPIEAVNKLLQSVPIEWRPVLALMAFCGIRPQELVSATKDTLRISAINFSSRKITIGGQVTKVRSARTFEPPPNVWQWLDPLKKRKDSDFIAPASYDVWRNAKDKTGVKIPQDALRHSFASYAYHFLGAEHTVEILGHVGGFGVFAKHYKGLATPNDAKAYFNIMPKD